jgi:hypothetical protein
MTNLGKLKKIDLRTGWKHEALDFTRWLAEEENLALLSDEVGFDIKLIQTEAGVGDFSVDILAQEENTENKIIIENQLEKTNHDHLGKAITYASGYDAKVIIWIVKDVRDEHQKAIEWLNENTLDEIGFYLIRIELWQIGDSLPAPKFEIVCKPNDWAKAVKSSAEAGELTETKLKQKEFWEGFKSFAKQNGTSLKFRKSNPQHWTNVALGSSECHIAFTINSREKEFACEVYISDNKDFYRKLYEQKDQIEKDLNEKLEWLELPEKKACRIKLSISGDFDNQDKWENYFEWLQEKGEKFKKVFPRYF